MKKRRKPKDQLVRACPWCGSEDLSFNAPHNREHDTVTQLMKCLKCKRLWKDIYRLDGIEQRGIIQ